jgi:hypothetical protein
MDRPRYPLWNSFITSLSLLKGDIDHLIHSIESLYQSRRQQTMYELHPTTINQQLKRVSMGWHCPWQMVSCWRALISVSSL